MKKLLLALLCSIATGAYAQMPSGLIAHWNMNGTTNDVSGHGHNGHGHSLVPAVGRDGVMGHAYSFDGVSSAITVPYSSEFNVSGYSIAASIKVTGFYTGTCHANSILNRGSTTVVPGQYYLMMSDYPSGGGCVGPLDVTRESFVANATGSSACLGATSAATFGPFNVTPYIAENVWYNVVATFNDTVFKIYLDNVLIASMTSPYPGVPMGTSMDSMGIGYAPYDGAVGYPYFFHGLMDDVMLFNRALSDTEITHLFDTCGQITTQPVAVTTTLGSTAKFISHSSLAGPNRQWQQNSGTGFVNLSNAGAFSGVFSDTLTISGVTAAMNGNLYRCVVDNESSCSDTSTSASLTLDLAVNDLSQNGSIYISPNPARGLIEVASDGRLNEIAVYNMVGRVMYSSKTNDRNITIDVSTFPAGMYLVKSSGGYVGKFTKE